MAMSMSLGARPEWSSPVQLFQRFARRGPGAIRDLPPFDVTANGQTFLLNASAGLYFPYTVIVNWPELLRARSADRQTLSLHAERGFALYCELFRRRPLLPPIYSKLLFPSFSTKSSHRSRALWIFVVVSRRDAFARRR